MKRRQPFLIAGILFFFNVASDVYWIAAGVLSVLPYLLYTGWVLTVEVKPRACAPDARL